MQLVLFAGLPFCTCSLFEGFYLVKQLFSLFAMDNLLFYGFFCLSIQATNNSNDVLPNFIER